MKDKMMKWLHTVQLKQPETQTVRLCIHCLNWTDGRSKQCLTCQGKKKSID